MTRLTTWDIQGITHALPTYDASLIKKTGCSLRQIACLAMQVSENDIQASLEGTVVGVVPMTSGDGVLNGFCGMVSEIAGYLGCKTFVTEKTDAAGIAEAMERNAEILMFADEDRFIALHMQHRKLVDNAVATGRGFIAGLELMAGGLKDKKVLVLGCGPVGQCAVRALGEKECRVSVYDSNTAVYDHLSRMFSDDTSLDVQFLNDLDPALRHHELMVDATPTGNFIQAQHITPRTIISAPGMPVGLDNSALKAIGNRLLHDPLQIGVAAMVVGALK